MESILIYCPEFKIGALGTQPIFQSGNLSNGIPAEFRWAGLNKFPEWSFGDAKYPERVVMFIISRRQNFELHASVVKAVI